MPVDAWRPDVPYNDLPHSPGVDDLETRAVLKAAVAANTALAQLDQAVAATHNPAVLINAIPIPTPGELRGEGSCGLQGRGELRVPVRPL